MRDDHPPGPLKTATEREVNNFKGVNALHLEHGKSRSGFRTLLCGSEPRLSMFSRDGAIRSGFESQIARPTAFDCLLSSDLNHNKKVIAAIRSRLCIFKVKVQKIFQLFPRRSEVARTLYPDDTYTKQVSRANHPAVLQNVGGYRGISRIRNRRPLGPYSRTMPRVLWGS